MILISHFFHEFVLHIPSVPSTFYCRQKLHECIGKLRLLEQCLIVVTGSRWVLFVTIVCPISSLGNCWLPLQLLLWSDFWMFVLLFLLSFVDDSLVELTALCNFSWFLLCTLPRICCQGCVLLVALCPIPLALSIISGKVYYGTFWFVFHLFCVDIVSISSTNTMIYWLPLLDFAGKCPVWLLCISPALYISLIFFGGLGSTSASELPGMFSSSDHVFSFDFVNLTPWHCFFIWPFWDSLESEKCFWTADVVRLGHIRKFSALIASIHVSLTGNPAAARRYVIVCGIDGVRYPGIQYPTIIHG